MNHSTLISKKPEKHNKNDLDRNKDSGMALILLFLVAAHYFNEIRIITVAIILLLLNMIVPHVYKPFAKLWFGCSTIMGTYASKLLLTILYFIIVTPIGVIRRILVKDVMQTNKWKNGQDSVFIIRNHMFQKEDIEKPY